MDKKKIGRLGEDIASNFLEKQGIKILQKNYATKYGEIDLIALENETIIFIEVKLRKNKKFGSIIESISESKIKKISKAAELFLNEFDTFKECRFDIILIFLYNRNSYEVEWLKGEYLD